MEAVINNDNFIIVHLMCLKMKDCLFYGLFETLFRPSICL